MVDAVLHQRDLQIRPNRLHELIPVNEGLREIVPGVHMKQRERQAGRVESLPGQPGHDDRVLAAGEKQRGIAKLRGSLAQHINGLGLQLLKQTDVVGANSGHGRWGRDHTAPETGGK